MAKKVSKKVAKSNGNIKSRCIALLKKGVGPTEVARKVGCSLTTARYHASKLKGKANPVAEAPKTRSVAEQMEYVQKLGEEVAANRNMERLNAQLEEAAAVRDEYLTKYDEVLTENAKLREKIKFLKTMLLEEL